MITALVNGRYGEWYTCDTNYDVTFVFIDIVTTLLHSSLNLPVRDLLYL